MVVATVWSGVGLNLEWLQRGRRRCCLGYNDGQVVKSNHHRHPHWNQLMTNSCQLVASLANLDHHVSSCWITIRHESIRSMTGSDRRVDERTKGWPKGRVYQDRSSRRSKRRSRVILLNVRPRGKQQQQSDGHFGPRPRSVRMDRGPDFFPSRYCTAELSTHAVLGWTQKNDTRDWLGLGENSRVKLRDRATMGEQRSRAGTRGTRWYIGIGALT